MAIRAHRIQRGVTKHVKASELRRVSVQGWADRVAFLSGHSVFFGWPVGRRLPCLHGVGPSIYFQS